MAKEGSIVNKGYEIILDRIREGYLYDSIVCHAENVNKAKVALLEQVRHNGMILGHECQELTYLNIPVRRRPSIDIVIFEGGETARCDIDDILAKRKRTEELDAILQDPSISHCYIIKGGYYRPWSAGYTEHRWQAGIYPKDEAVSHARSVREITLVPINIEKHNKMMMERIKDLQSRIIEA